MRIGAIFARGSCRALKWMALVGMVFALGAGQAAAQPTMESATYTATSTGVTVMLDLESYLLVGANRSATELGGDFMISGGTLTAAVPGRSASLTTNRFPGSKMIVIEFQQVINNLKATAVPLVPLVLTYTPDTATAADALVIRSSLTDLPMTGTPTPTVGLTLTGPGVDPVATEVSLVIPPLQKEIFVRARGTYTGATAIELPEGTGLLGTTPRYELSPDLPANGSHASGLMFDANSRTLSTLATTGMVSSTVATWTIVYTVTDGGDRARTGPDNTASDTFTLRVADKPARMAAPTVTVAGPGSLAVEWTAPFANNAPILNYKLRYKATAGTTWTSAVPNITATKYTVTGLTPGSYDVQVRAVNRLTETTDGATDSIWWSPSGTRSTGAAPAKPSTTLTVGSTIPEGRDRIPVEVTVMVPPLPSGQTATRTVDVTLALMDPAATVKAEDAAELPSTLEDNPDVVWGTAQLSASKPATRKAITFTFSSNLSSSQTVYLETKPDTDAENEMFRISAASAAVPNVFAEVKAAVKATVTIKDAHEQKYELTLPYALETSGSLNEGNQGDVVPMKLVVMPPRTIAKSFIVSLESANDSADYSLSSGGLSSAGVAGNRLRIDMGVLEGSKDVTLTTALNDGDRVDDTVTLKIYEASPTTTTAVGEQLGDSVMLTVVDQHKLPKVTLGPIMVDGAAAMTVAEGETATVTLMADRGTPSDDITDTEAITVTLMHGAASTASADDYSLSVDKVTIGASKTSGMFMLEVATDEELEDEALVLMAEVTGTAAFGSTADTAELGPITLVDGTMKLVRPKTEKEIQDVIYPAKEAGMGADMMFNPGEMIVIETAAALFNSAEDVALSYSAMSDMEDVATVMVSGSMVTVTAQDMAGVMAHITITAHASLAAAGAMGLPQTDASEASIIFPVEVGLEAVSFTLMGPEDMNLVEGGMGGMVTATANREVTADVTINLMRDRAMSTADDMDFMAEAITIEAGMMMGTTMVMAEEDDMMEDMEELVLYGMAADNAGEVTGQVMFYIWDDAVPALPLIAQLLLGLFLAIGGYRRYLRR